jgi:hypothetical protein
MSNKPVGGRGHTAPYKTMVVRIPVDVQEQVEKIVDKFRDDLEANLGMVKVNSVNSKDDKLSRLSEIVEKYKLASKASRDWTKCNQLIDELTALI